MRQEDARYFVFMVGSTRSAYNTYNMQQVYSLYKHLPNGVYSSRALYGIYIRTWESVSPALGVWCTNTIRKNGQVPPNVRVNMYLPL
jgi:hypothetical protein